MASWCAAVSLVYANQSHFQDCKSASGPESDSCKQRYSKYPTFNFTFHNFNVSQPIFIICGRRALQEIYKKAAQK